MIYQQLETLVKQWADDRFITTNSNIKAQSFKTLEESGELIEAAAEIRILDEIYKLKPDLVADPIMASLYDKSVKKYMDALGDVLVTLIVGSSTAGISLVECLNLAYNEIKDRRGFLSPDGKFVKEQS